MLLFVTVASVYRRPDGFAAGFVHSTEGWIENHHGD